MKGISPKYTPVARLVYFICHKNTITESEAQGKSR